MTSRRQSIIAHYGRNTIKPAVATNNDAAMYSGNDTDAVRSMPVMIGAVMPARRERAEAIPVALPL